METFSLQEIISAALMGQSFAQAVLDLLLKSTIIIGLTFVIARLFRTTLSNSSSHLLWLNCLCCIALLPFVSAAIGAATTKLVGQEAITIITVQPGIMLLENGSIQASNLLLIALYLLVTFCFLIRLLLFARGLRRLSKTAVSVSTGETVKQLASATTKLGLTRRVLLKLSDDVDSPMSFGLVRPVVILPTAATRWSESTLEAVLLHELSHIKRLNWPTMLFCHLLCSLFWITPLVWFAKKQVNEAAEKACDSEVLAHVEDGANYADDLLRFARMSRSNRRPLLAQLMFDESSLLLRIRNILDGNLSSKINKPFISTMIGYAAISIVIFSNINVFGDDEKQQDQEFLPLITQIPMYPSQAAAEGIEGWALVSFTVTAYGAVDAGSIQLVDSEPPYTFDSASFRAAEQFSFEPRITDGLAVDVPGVQYLFRYLLK